MLKTQCKEGTLKAGSSSGGSPREVGHGEEGKDTCTAVKHKSICMGSQIQWTCTDSLLGLLLINNLIWKISSLEITAQPLKCWDVHTGWIKELPSWERELFPHRDNSSQAMYVNPIISFGDVSRKWNSHWVLLAGDFGVPGAQGQEKSGHRTRVQVIH